MNPLYPIKYIFYLRTLNKKARFLFLKKNRAFFLNPIAMRRPMRRGAMQLTMTMVITTNARDKKKFQSYLHLNMRKYGLYCCCCVLLLCSINVMAAMVLSLSPFTSLFFFGAAAMWIRSTAIDWYSKIYQFINCIVGYIFSTVCLGLLFDTLLKIIFLHRAFFNSFRTKLLLLEIRFLYRELFNSFWTKLFFIETRFFT